MPRMPGVIALVIIVLICVFFLLLLPNGLDNVTSSTVFDDGITFENYYPPNSLEIIGNCYKTDLQIDYSFKCSFCNPKDIREYFWFKKSGEKEFTLINSDRKTIKSGKVYTAEKEVEVCTGNSYEWYVCIDDVTLKCAGKNKPFRFDVS